MAMVTTEICLSLEQYSKVTINRLVICDEPLKKIGIETNTVIEHEKKGNVLYILGEPRNAKEAHSKLRELLKYFSDFGMGTPIIDEVAEEEVKLLSKEFTNGVIFRRFNDGNVLQMNIPSTYVLDPIRMNNENERGGIGANSMWDLKSFVEWKFALEVIREASKTLVGHLGRLSPEAKDYFKVEISMGKVIFYRNTKDHSLDGTKFAVKDFCNLKKTVSSFRKYMDKSLIENLEVALSKLGYDREGNTLKVIRIHHIMKHENGDSYTNIWSLDLLDGETSDNKPRLLKLSKIRILKRSPFSTTIHNPATAFDFKLSIITCARECDESIQEIYERISHTYRYSPERGLLVNSAIALKRGYKPLVHAESRIFKETTWIRGGIKVSILEIEDGSENTFEVKIQNNQLKDYIRGAIREAPLDYVMLAVKELFEAAEEIRDELNIFSGSEYPADISLGPVGDVVNRPRSPEKGSKKASNDVCLGKLFQNVSLHQVKQTTPPEHVTSIIAPKKLHYNAQQSSAEPSWRPLFHDSSIQNTIRTFDDVCEGGLADGISNFKPQIITSTRFRPPPGPSVSDGSSLTQPEFLHEIGGVTNVSPAPSTSTRSKVTRQTQNCDLTSWNTLYITNGLDLYQENYFSRPQNQPQMSSDIFVGIPDTGAIRGSVQGCSHKKKTDLFENFHSTTDDYEQLIPLIPAAPATYNYDNEYLGEDFLMS